MKLIATLVRFTQALLLAGCAGLPFGGIGGAVTPQPGARFIGAIAAAGQVESGTVIFTVSADGQNLTSIGLVLSGTNCANLSAREVRNTIYGEYAVEGGRFTAPAPTIGVLEGTFTSPTTAEGTITVKIATLAGELICELGTFSWRAEAQEESGWTWEDLALYPDHRNVRECYDWSPHAHMMESEKLPRVEAWCFTTSTAAEAVLAFYENELDASGWTDPIPGAAQQTDPLGLYRMKGDFVEVIIITISETAGNEVEVEVARGWKDE